MFEIVKAIATLFLWIYLAASVFVGVAMLGEFIYSLMMAKTIYEAWADLKQSMIWPKRHRDDPPVVFLIGLIGGVCLALFAFVHLILGWWGG